jgi:iron complex outermembrane receptor protein
VDASWTAEQVVLNPRFASPTDYDRPTARVDRHFLLNARLGYASRAAGAQSEIYLAAENLTDEEYEYRPGYPMPPVTWMTGIRVNF